MTTGRINQVSSSARLARLVNAKQHLSRTQVNSPCTLTSTQLIDCMCIDSRQDQGAGQAQD